MILVEKLSLPWLHEQEKCFRFPLPSQRMRIIAFTSAIRRTFDLPYFIVHQNLCSGAALNSSKAVTIAPESEKDNQQAGTKSLSCRIEKLRKGESVTTAFQSWMGDGFPIHRGEVFHTINRLRKLKCNKRALEVRYPVWMFAKCLLKCFMELQLEQKCSMRSFRLICFC